MSGYVCFSHGLESGPQGAKIAALTEVAEALGFEVEALDYRGQPDPDLRVEKLLAHGRAVTKPLVLAGSSLGGYVATVAAAELPALGLFLLAPALYLPGPRRREYRPGARVITVVQGWRDEVIPLENTLRFARENQATLHLVDGDHRLIENIPELKVYFRLFLEAVTKESGYNR
ncbi:MAG: YqiA/YcfP family alpha/beta fold hydrolase [Thermodesulfobacteriota bacterium]